jgi:hypothetical protein
MRPTERPIYRETERPIERADRDRQTERQREA